MTIYSYSLCVTDVNIFLLTQSPSQYGSFSAALVASGGGGSTVDLVASMASTKGSFGLP